MCDLSYDTYDTYIGDSNNDIRPSVVEMMAKITSPVVPLLLALNCRFNDLTVTLLATFCD